MSNQTIDGANGFEKIGLFMYDIVWVLVGCLIILLIILLIFGIIVIYNNKVAKRDGCEK